MGLLFPDMDVDAKSPLAGFNDQTIFVVYKSKRQSNGIGAVRWIWFHQNCC